MRSYQSTSFSSGFWSRGDSQTHHRTLPNATRGDAQADIRDLLLKGIHDSPPIAMLVMACTSNRGPLATVRIAQTGGFIWRI